MMKREKLKKNTVNIWSYIKNYKFNSMFIQSFLIVFVLFCIPFLLFSSLYYNNVKNSTYEDIERESRTMLYEMRDLTDTVLLQCESLCTYLANRSQSQMFALNNWYGSTGINASLSEYLKSLPLIYDYIDSIYIYSEIHNSVITNENSAVLPIENFSDNEWIDDYRNISSVRGIFSARFKNDNYPMLISIITPILIENDNVGAVILNVDARELCGSFIDNRSYNDGQRIFVISESGQVYVSNNREFFLKDYSEIPYLEILKDFKSEGTKRYEVLGESNMITVEASDKFPLYYINSKSMSLYQDRLHDMVTQIAVMIIILVVLSLLVAYFLAIRSYRPVMKIISVLDNPEKYGATGRDNQNEMKYIITNILKNIHTTAQMQTELENRLELLKAAQIAMLQMQINPHFLYNTLDTINWMAVGLSGGANDVSKAINNLAGLYRTNINTGDYLITLRDEIEQAKLYINILKLRYDELFDVIWDIDDDALDCIVLKLCMQPIIENAVYHGLKPMKRGGVLTVRGGSADNKVVIVIQDNGVGIEEDELKELNHSLNEDISPSGKKGHIGLYNVNQRIKLIYGNDYGVYVSSEKNSGTIVRMIFPETYMKN